MKEVICPQCHTAFTIDENNYEEKFRQAKDEKDTTSSVVE